jgi:hypothetical protein
LLLFHVGAGGDDLVLERLDGEELAGGGLESVVWTKKKKKTPSLSATKTAICNVLNAKAPTPYPTFQEFPLAAALAAPPPPACDIQRM